VLRATGEGDDAKDDYFELAIYDNARLAGGASVIVVTGVAGFIGSNLAQRFLAEGRKVAGLDNLRLGQIQNIQECLKHRDFAFAQADLADIVSYRKALYELNKAEPIEEIWHMAANSDIPAGIHDPQVDLRDTFMTTFNTVQVMREMRIPSLAFASSSAIYGDLGETALEETDGPLLPISYYGAMKLASEGIISAATETDLSRVFLFRFPNVVGIPATHGVIVDFVRRLKANPLRLDVLGDGSQRKSYLHVDDLVDAMVFIRNKSMEKRSLFNIGVADDGITVKFIAELVRTEVSPRAEIVYGAGNRGWIGDVPKFRYSVEKVRSLGWAAKLRSEEAVRKAVKQIARQELKY
jgi:UDP-glucose 4-epimerase